jgi:predicted Zn finger-like uncharacterized protein
VFLVIAIIFGIICAVIAHYKGRSVIAWFFLGFLFGVFGFIAIMVVSNLKAARQKEDHIEMQQRRLREQLRQERLKTEQLRKYTQVRLDAHDKELNIDTRHIGPLLEQANIRSTLDNGQELSEEPVPVEDERKSGRMKAQCPHCQARFRVPDEYDRRKAECPKCNKPFVIARFVESTPVQECTSCGREIAKLEQACIFEGRVVCKQCDETLRKGSNEANTKTQGWYYQQQDTTVGPLSLEMVKRLAQQGKINSSTSVWHESLDNWTLAGKVGELGYGDWPWLTAK